VKPDGRLRTADGFEGSIHQAGCAPRTASRAASTRPAPTARSARPATAGSIGSARRPAPCSPSTSCVSACAAGLPSPLDISPAFPYHPFRRHLTQDRPPAPAGRRFSCLANSAPAMDAQALRAAPGCRAATMAVAVAWDNSDLIGRIPR
jgi:hypothetical protein